MKLHALVASPSRFDHFAGQSPVGFDEREDAHSSMPAAPIIADRSRAFTLSRVIVEKRWRPR